MSAKSIYLNKSLFLFAASLALLLFFLKWIELRFIIIDHAFELYIGCIALIFTLLGIWLAMKITVVKLKTVIIEKEIEVIRSQFVRNEDMIQKLGLSGRELVVLQEISQGLSNQEIADKLFVSINTVKTHTSNILQKLDVKRRTQAIEKAKRLNIIE